MPLHRRFEAQARRSPAAVALRFRHDAVTFAELDAASSRVAHALRARGIGAGACVGLHLDRSIRYHVAMLGILKSGAAVVPLPPSYPESRRREILEFARLDAVIDDDDSRLVANALDRVIPLSQLEVGQDAPLTASADDAEATAFVLCSSGSTGKPKMIARSHRSFFHRLEWTWSNWPFAPGEACCQKSHMTTTHAIYELFEPLLAGIPVRVIADEDVRDLQGFWDTIRREGISRLLIVPSVLQASLELPGFVAPPVRVLVLMGEYLHPQLARRAIDAFPADTRIFSIYGSTEASSTLVCDVRGAWRAGEELPLGTPIAPQVRALVLGPEGSPVAPGESGLLHIAGPALFREYFRNPELTGSVFRRGTEPDERIFNTSDQVRLREDGSLEYVGRVDHTVKVRGFRVDLGDVERALLAHPGVRQAAVLLAGDAVDNPPLVAFYAPAAVPREAVFATLRDRLPPYMVPSVVRGLESFPLTASGKVDRRALLADFAREATGPGADEGLTPSEAAIAGVWREVLKHGDVHRDSNFFEVGGTSLSVFTVLQRLRESTGLGRDALSDHAIYQYPTVRGLAGCIDALREGRTPAAGGGSAVAVTLKPGDGSLAPLFVIASSGGTLGAYDRLAKALRSNREIVGIRDPFVWGERDPTCSFQEWISVYLGAIRQRQPAGPYFICAFSSAGAFGCELAQRLRADGDEVARLVLIDPIGIAGEAEGDFGHRAFRALFRGRRSKWLVRVAGWWRYLARVGPRDSARAGENDFRMDEGEFQRRASAVRQDRKIIKDLSSLFELNTGLPFTMTDEDFVGMRPDEYLGAFLARVKSVTPDVDAQTIERILVQYYCLQLPATHFYRLKTYDSRVDLIEPDSVQVGLLGAYFRPYVRDLGMQVLRIGAPSPRTELVCSNLSRSLRIHYRSMRDDTFVAGLAAAMEPMLR